MTLSESQLRGRARDHGLTLHKARRRRRGWHGSHPYHLVDVWNRGVGRWMNLKQVEAELAELSTLQRERLMITAHHEAGHAVAAVMRSGGELVSITIEPADDYLGRTGTLVKAFGDDATFVTFAGPWAEARVQWPGSDEDEDDCVFDDYLDDAWLQNSDGDEGRYLEDLDRERAQWGELFDNVIDVRRREAKWSRELENHWPVITAVAELLLAGEHVDHQTVEGLLHRHWNGLL